MLYSIISRHAITSITGYNLYAASWPPRLDGTAGIIGNNVGAGLAHSRLPMFILVANLTSHITSRRQQSVRTSRASDKCTRAFLATRLPSNSPAVDSRAADSRQPNSPAADELNQPAAEQPCSRQPNSRTAEQPTARQPNDPEQQRHRYCRRLARTSPGSDRITISRSPRRGLTRLAIDGAQHSHDEVRSENHTHKRAPDAGAKAQQERMMAPEARTTLTR
ncbi:unnamed protein product [Trichogramma brassicae]|uniref:Uncharacterized protein n=1 Tax=Trichogramma brassicae TaxID=86971 RepID=A0A6H5J0Y6_9HYME|nr:unnamed protein product [Trichogramma brassicae]